METIKSISCPIPENNGQQHFIDKPADLPCTSTQNIQNTNIAISVRNKCAKKIQDDIKLKIDAPLQYKKIKIKQIKSAKDLTQAKTLICLEKVPFVKKIR